MFASKKIFTLAAAIGFMTLGLAIGSTAEAGLIKTPRADATSEYTPIALKKKVMVAGKKTAQPRVHAVNSADRPVASPLRRVASLNTVQVR